MAAVGLALLPRWLCDRGGERRLATTLLHPVAVCVLAAMILVSVHRARSGGRVEWRGRLYPAGDDTAP